MIPRMVSEARPGSDDPSDPRTGHHGEMARPSASSGRDGTRTPVLPPHLDPLELDGLEDHDGWSERSVTGSAIAADAEHISFGRCTITGMRFTAAQVRRLELTDVVVANCDLAGAVFEEASFE